jgi:hypothetical protein
LRSSDLPDFEVFELLRCLVFVADVCRRRGCKLWRGGRAVPGHSTKNKATLLALWTGDLAKNAGAKVRIFNPIPEGAGPDPETRLPESDL